MLASRFFVLSSIVSLLLIGLNATAAPYHVSKNCDEMVKRLAKENVNTSKLDSAARITDLAQREVARWESQPRSLQYNQAMSCSMDALFAVISPKDQHLGDFAKTRPTDRGPLMVDPSKSEKIPAGLRSLGEDDECTSLSGPCSDRTGNGGRAPR